MPERKSTITKKKLISHNYRLIGYQVYRKINFVVSLRENFRHRHDLKWVDILTNRLRYGTLTQEDLDYINSVAFPASTPLNTPTLSDTHINPYLTTSNQTRFFFNNSCVASHAKLLGEDIHYFPAIVKANGTCLAPNELRSLFKISDDKVARKMILLKLFLGMPVKMTRNHKNPHLKISNGAVGHVVGYQLSKDARYPIVTPKGAGRYNLHRHSEPPDIIFVKINGEEDVLVDGLPPGVVPITSHKTSAHNIHLPNRTISVDVTQISLVPAYSLTADSCQGISY